MSWWGSVKNIYGLIMGTSTDWMKPVKRAHWPTAFHEVDSDFKVFLGGTGNCGILMDGDRQLLINCNSGISAQALFQGLGDHGEQTLIGTSNFPDYIGGLNRGSWAAIYLPDSENKSHLAASVKNESSAQVHWLSEPQSFSWGNETVSLIPVELGFSKKDLLVYLHNRKTLFTGGVFYNGVHPVLDSGRGQDPKKWLRGLKDLAKLLPGPVETYIPHEGDLCDHTQLDQFCQYLQTLMNHDVEFAHCRKNFDWIEIPGYTSLEENFNFLRK